MLGIVREGGRLVVRGREGLLAAESRNDARRMFAAWVVENESRLEPAVRAGEPLVGEWLALVHGTRYALTHELFVSFDLVRGPSRERVTSAELASYLPENSGKDALYHRGSR